MIMQSFKLQFNENKTIKLSKRAYNNESEKLRFSVILQKYIIQTYSLCTAYLKNILLEKKNTN